MRPLLGLTHLLFALATVYVLELPVVYGMVGGLLPDIDGAFDAVFPFVHRGILHTPVFVGFAMLAAYLITDRKSVSLSLGAGILTHLYLDTFTFSGIMWLFPVTETFSFELLAYNSFIGNIGFSLLAVAVALTWHYQYEVGTWLR